MSSLSEKHSHKGPAGSDALRSPLKRSSLDGLHQPRPRPSGLSTFLNPHSLPLTTYVDDWLESLDQDRKQYSKSDSHLTRISRLFHPTRILSGSGQEMPRKSTPSDTPSGASWASSTSSSVIGASGYRELNLAHNGIHFRSMGETLPEHVRNLVDDMSKERQSPEPKIEEIKKASNLTDLTDVNGAERVVIDHFKTHIFENPKDSSRLKGLSMTNEGYTMRKEHVPSSDDPEINLRLVQPKPDILYGYSWEAFTSSQQRQFMKMTDTEYTANSLRLIYPYFVIEFKGDAPGSPTGSLWVATNQCVGGAAACINMAEKLNRHIERFEAPTVQPVDTTVFSIAMNGSEARLFVSWKEGDCKYNTQQIEGFLVYKPEQYLMLRRYVRNVIEWGKDNRLAQIGAVLDAILEESRKRSYDAINGASEDAIERNFKRQK